MRHRKLLTYCADYYRARCAVQYLLSVLTFAPSRFPRLLGGVQSKEKLFSESADHRAATSYHRLSSQMKRFFCVVEKLYPAWQVTSASHFNDINTFCIIAYIWGDRKSGGSTLRKWCENVMTSLSGAPLHAGTYWNTGAHTAGGSLYTLLVYECSRPWLLAGFQRVG